MGYKGYRNTLNRTPGMKVCTFMCLLQCQRLARTAAFQRISMSGLQFQFQGKALLQRLSQPQHASCRDTLQIYSAVSWHACDEHASKAPHVRVVALPTPSISERV